MGKETDDKQAEMFAWMDAHKNESWLSALVEFGETFKLGVEETAEIYNKWHRVTK
jgi:hypothetical protein